MLTPIDIDNKQFSRQLKGYNVDEVDDFLDEISADYERAMLMNKNLEDKISELENILQEYKNAEGSLQDTLLIAKQTADNIRQSAETEANKVLDEAEKVYRDKTGNIDGIIEGKKQELNNIQESINVFKRKSEALLVAQLEILKTFEDEEKTDLNNSDDNNDNNE
mgnify:CR=1 FL=1